MIIRQFLFSLVLLSGILLSNDSWAAMQSLPEIAKTAKSFLKFQLGSPDKDLEIHIGKIDPRLRLQACNIPLQAFVPPGSDLRGNSIVGVRCVGDVQWQLYVPVQIKLFEEVVVFSKPLNRGHTIVRSDLTTVRRDTQQLRKQAVLAPEKLVGATMKRRVNQGEIASLNDACMICKGEKLKIVAKNTRVSVSMPGIALEDGFFGRTIRIENTSSSKVITGTVIAKSTVEVGI